MFYISFNFFVKELFFLIRKAIVRKVYRIKKKIILIKWFYYGLRMRCCSLKIIK